MTATTFDALEYAKKLENAGFTRAQAEAQAEAMRQQSEAQAAALRQLSETQAAALRRQSEAQGAALRSAIREYDESRQKELATKGDVANVRLEVEKVRLEMEKVRAEVEKVRAEMKDGENRLLKWQFGIAFALAAIMAKGFGWIGF